jgi:hypothetical protein
MKNIITYIAITIGLICIGISIYEPKPTMPSEYKNAIDSLTKANNALQQKQRELDSVIGNYQIQIYDLDYKLSNIKEKTTVIKEYYHEISKQTQSYNTTQVDSFLRNRFNY